MMNVVHRVFRSQDLIAGHVVLDFVNTVNGRDAVPSDWLDCYERLLDWASLTGAFRRETLLFLRAAARADPRSARRSLAAARLLREVLFEVLSALARGNPAPPSALGRLENRWKRSVALSSLGGA